MTNSIVDAETVVAIDIGSVSTRAILFDVVDSQYCFIAAGTAPTTVTAPIGDPLVGVVQAVRHLQEVTGRDLLGAEGRMIIPTQPNGSGLDRLVVAYSAGPELNIVVSGLLSDVSLESAQRLAASTPGQVYEAIGLSDRRRQETQLDAILKGSPDLVIVAGGTQGGASRSMSRIVDLLILLCRVLPPEKRPEILYTGNSALGKRFLELIEKWTPVKVAPNIRPSVDVEDLSPAQNVLSQLITRARMRQMPGLVNLASLSSSPPVPVAYAFGRMVRFLSKLYDPAKSVLGVDLGASGTLVAAGNGGKLNMVSTPYGTGQGLEALLKSSQLQEISRWLPMHLSESTLPDYIWQKTFHPSLIPVSAEALAIEQALARQALRLAMQQFKSRYPAQNPFFEPILAAGAVLTQAPLFAQTLLMLLDGLQPAGITTLVLDQNRLTAMLGAVSDFSAVLPVQVLDSGAYLNLGTVICPVSEARYGTPILEVNLDYGAGSTTHLEVRQGELKALTLKQGQTAVIQVKALRGTVIDPRSRKNIVKFKITGGACGAVIDGRGRPLVLPPDDSRRRDLLKKWAMALGG